MIRRNFNQLHASLYMEEDVKRHRKTGARKSIKTAKAHKHAERRIKASNR